MAALLCKSIAQLCGGLVDACVKLPCNICCEACSTVVCSPFFPYLAITVALNLPPMIWSIQSIATASCSSSSTSNWLLLNGIATAIHILASFYIVYQVVRTSSSPAEAGEDDAATEPQKVVEEGKAVVSSGTTTTTTTTTTHYKRVEETAKDGGDVRASMTSFYILGKDGDEANSFSRLSQVLCYDVGVAIYIVVFVAWILLQMVGVSLFFKDNNDDDSCRTYTRNSIICGYFYMTLVFVAFCCSLFCLRGL